ncbi:MAG: hypothetical protein ABSH48_17455 [Verrucomicrobiota bacterium]|jgi:hypothetical protein
MTKLPIWLLLLPAFWVAPNSLAGEPADSSANLATGKEYTLDPAPNYSLCTDPGDATQLTDGQYVSGRFWTQIGTVGWVDASPVTITIDLEKSQPIGGLSFNTAAENPDVKWPLRIFILVSENGKMWRFVGDLVALSAQKSTPPASGYAVHRFQTRDLSTRGRFVKLLVVPSGQSVFVDEIEIYSATEPVPAAAPGGLGSTDVNALFRRLCTEAGLKRRLQIDLSAVRSELGGLDENAKRPLETELASIAAAIPSVDVASPETFTTVFPINDLHRRIFAVQAAEWRAKGLRGITLWQSDRWGMISPTGIPIPGNPELDVPMISREFRADAFNLSNAGETNARVSLVLEGLPGHVNPDYVTLHEVPFTDTQSGIPVAAALVPIAAVDGCYPLQIPPGLTRQVWFTFHPTNVPAGTYTGRILVASAGISNQVPIQLKIWPFQFPDHPTLHLSGWDYTDADHIFDLTPENRDALVRILREHFVDSPWAFKVLPTGAYNAQGRMIQPPDPTAFRTWLDRWPDARLYCVAANAKTNFAGFALGTPAFQYAVGNWINWWVKQLKKWRIKPSQLCLLLVDEPHTAGQDHTIIEYAKVIGTAQPGVVIWEDPAWTDPTKATPELFDRCRVLCPHLPTWIDAGSSFANFYCQQQAAGHRLWFYSCRGPSRLLDPYTYYRLQAWFAWKYRAEGSAFWSFCDSSGASSWNEYPVLCGGYTPLFLDTKGTTSGKQMEAIREGLEDYEYLRILSDRLQQAPANAVIPDIVAARKLLTEVVDRLTAPAKPASAQYWSVAKDRSLADQFRVEVLDAMVKLK